VNDDLYLRLGVAENAPVEVISAAYKALLKRQHPDLATDEADRVQREQACRLLGEAHAVLSDTSSRRDYDLRLADAHKEHLADEKREAYGSRDGRGNAKADGAGHVPPRAGKSNTDTKRGEHGSSRGSDGYTSPSGEVVRRYDDLSVTARRRLDLLAFGDREWRQFRRVLLASRARLGGFPLSWFGTSDPVPATPASWRLVGMMIGSFNATLIAASLLWATGWFRKLAADVVGELWLVPVVQVPVMFLAGVMLIGSLLIMWWLRRYGGWFSMSTTGRLRLSVWSTGWGLITMFAPLMVFPGVIVAALVAAGLWWSQR
jgi:hypothetical protein